MKKMINSLCRVFLVAAVMVMPLCGMQLGVVKKVDNNVALLNEIVEKAHKMIDAAMDTLTLVDQKQQDSGLFEAAKKELVKLMEKIDLAIIDLNKIDLNARIKLAQLVNRVDSKIKIKLAPLMDKIDFKTRIKLVQLMRKIDLDGEVQKAMKDAIKTIQNTRVETKLVVPRNLNTHLEESQDAYNRLHDTTDYITQAVAPQSTMQQVIDYVSRKFQEAQQAVSTMWYGKGNKE